MGHIIYKSRSLAGITYTLVTPVSAPAVQGRSILPPFFSHVSLHKAMRIQKSMKCACLEPIHGSLCTIQSPVVDQILVPGTPDFCSHEITSLFQCLLADLFSLKQARSLPCSWLMAGSVQGIQQSLHSWSKISAHLCGVRAKGKKRSWVQVEGQKSLFFSLILALKDS